MSARRPFDSIHRFTAASLTEGEIWSRFRRGTQVVCLEEDPRVQKLCASLVESLDTGSEFWEQSIFDLARHHIPGDTNFGDLLRFVPGQYGHLARKAAFFPSTVKGEYVVHPGFEGSDSGFGLCQPEILELVWELATNVLQSALPEKIDLTHYAATIELLKYPDSAQELENIFSLIEDSARRWAKLGHKIDLAAASACGPFDRRLVRQLYAWSSVVPGIGAWIRSFNEMFGDSPYHAVPADRVVVGPPHVDGIRYLTMLTGSRSTIKTEIFDAAAWIEVPVESRSLSIFPGLAYQQEYGIPACVHRYTIAKCRSDTVSNSPNVTLLLGVIPRSQVLLQNARIVN